ncbi:protein aknad1 [Limosa lapponica baueri]|uniref:Protein aknad1 n=1 Tax=Limosa lapponica baueri TaxID=1758121 RepID=A0A2I0UKS3_LIMLA|nr:protein aknad1 [Limosa lapponica baueri]
MKTQMNSSFSGELGCITDATDEEQDDLPYDEDVGITCKYSNSDNLNDCPCTKVISGILNLACSENNKSIKATANYETHPQPEEFSSHHRTAIGITGISVEMSGSEASFRKELPVGGFSKPDSKDHLTNSKMSDILLRHFSNGELISTCQLIECETIPEISFTESISDTVNKPEPSEHLKGPLAHKQWATNFEEYHLEKHKEVNTGDKSQNSLNENRCVSKKPVSSTGKCGYRQENSQLINENEDTHLFQNMKEDRDLFKKTVSRHDLKYGQGQAHYCLPDFSKVASEVKVPERSDNIKSVPTTERTKSFPIFLSKSVIGNNILENKNYFNSAEVENQEEMSIPELLQQLEDLDADVLEEAEINLNSRITKSLFSLVLYVEINILVQPFLTELLNSSNCLAAQQLPLRINGTDHPVREGYSTKNLTLLQNFEAAKTCYSSIYGKIILSHQYLPSKKSAQSKSAINIRNRNANDSNANILSSTLDHAIHTANILKKATERMVRAVSEDLAKVKRKQL